MRDIDEGENATVQVDLYKQTKRMVENVESLRNAPNLSEEADLTADDVDTAFSACGYVYLGPSLKLFTQCLQ